MILLDIKRHLENPRQHLWLLADLCMSTTFLSPAELKDNALLCISVNNRSTGIETWCEGYNSSHQKCKHHFMFHLSPPINNHTHRSKVFYVSDIRQALQYFFFSWWSIMWFWNKSDKQFLTLHMFKDLCQEGENSSYVRSWSMTLPLWSVRRKGVAVSGSAGVNSRTQMKLSGSWSTVASVDSQFYALGERNVFTFFHTLWIVCLQCWKAGRGCWNQRPIS